MFFFVARVFFDGGVTIQRKEATNFWAPKGKTTTSFRFENRLGGLAGVRRVPDVFLEGRRGVWWDDDPETRDEDENVGRRRTRRPPIRNRRPSDNGTRGDEEGKEEGRRGGGLPKRFKMGRKSRAKSERKARGTQIRSEGETKTRSFTRFAVEEVSIWHDYSRCKFREMPVETPAGFLQKTSMEIIRVGSEERTAEREFERRGDEVFGVGGRRKR